MFIYRRLATLLATLPMVLIAVAWEYLPIRLPMHFAANGQPDRFASRYEWYGHLLGTLLMLLGVRALVLKVVNNKLGNERQPALQLVTAGFVASFMSLLILQGLYNHPLYAQWQSVLVAVLASSFMYFIVPANEPLPSAKSRPLTPDQPNPLGPSLQPLSRLIGIRVNLLAALLAGLARPQDRWSIIIMANALALLSVAMLWLIKQRQAT